MVLIPNFPPVHFGCGAIGNLERELLTRGILKPLIITDPGLVEHGIYQNLYDALPSELSVAVYDQIPENPTIAGVEAALLVYQANNCDGILALGGGSVLDSGKALRVITNQDKNLIAYLKDPSLITPDVAPYVTIPTTAGTGAEITSGGGIHPTTNAPALGLRNPNIQPDVAICDPDMTITLPPHLTAATGMDALTHCVEGYLSTNFNPPTEAIALDGIARVVMYVERAYSDGSDIDARTNMSMAALQGGMSIGMGLGPIHALSMAFGDSPLHHGTLVTVAMPAVMRFYNELEGGKLARIAEAMGLPADGNEGNRIADRVTELNASMKLPKNIRQMGYSKNDLDRMIDDAYNSFFNHPAPKVPNREDYEIMVSEVLG